MATHGQIPSNQVISAGSALIRNTADTAWTNKAIDNIDNTSDSNKPVSDATQTELNTKVDKVTGKGLSTNDYTDSDKNKLLGIENGAQVNDVTSVNSMTGDVILEKDDFGLGNVDNTSDEDKPISTATQTELDDKVDKVSGKGLSTEDYTSSEKTKLSGIESGAQVNTVASVNGDTGSVVIEKSDIGLGSVDNTSDSDKPVSDATQLELDKKVSKSGDEISGSIAIYDEIYDNSLIIAKSKTVQNNGAVSYSSISTYAHLGGGEWHDNGTYGIGFGYKPVVGDPSPVWVGGQTIDTSGKTTAAFVVAVKPSNDTTTPKAYFSVDPQGDISSWTGYTPQYDESLVNKKYIEESIEAIEAPVLSVNGHTGEVVLSPSDVGADAEGTAQSMLEDAYEYTDESISNLSIPKFITLSGTTTNGNVTFDVSSAGFTSLTAAGCIFRVNDSTSDCSYQTTSVSNTSVTVNVKRREFNGIVVATINVLGSTSMNNVPNGTTVIATFIGN